jgi:hypothetical protein
VVKRIKPNLANMLIINDKGLSLFGGGGGN